MADISQIVTDAILILEQKGLILEPWPEISPFPGGYEIAKPESVMGNTRPDYTVYFSSGEVVCDAPCTRIYPKGGKWVFELWEFIPGPGPGDFREEFLSITEAIPVIVDYYFGDPSKMNPPELLEYEDNSLSV